MLTVLPIRYVADVEVSRAFYADLGLTLDAAASMSIWAMLDADAGAVGLHDAAASKGRAPGTVELGFATDEKLEVVAERLSAKGHTYTIHTEDFGRSLRLTDPDGVELQIQEIDYRVARESEAAVTRDR